MLYKFHFKLWVLFSFFNSLPRYFSHATAAKSLQSCPTLCDPIDGSPPGSPIPGILQARTLEWVAISFSNAWKWKVKVKSLSRVRPSATPWTAAHQARPSMGFSRREYWSGVPLPSLRNCIDKPYFQETDSLWGRELKKKKKKLYCEQLLASILVELRSKGVSGLKIKTLFSKKKNTKRDTMSPVEK